MTSSATSRRVVVTGVGVVTPLGCDAGSLWDSLIAGQCGIRPLSILDTSSYKIHFGGDIPDFDVTEMVDAKEAKRLDRFTQFAGARGSPGCHRLWDRFRQR